MCLVNLVDVTYVVHKRSSANKAAFADSFYSELDTYYINGETS